MSDVFQHRSIHEADHIEALQQQIRELTRQRDDARDLAVRSGIFESEDTDQYVWAYEKVGYLRVISPYMGDTHCGIDNARRWYSGEYADETDYLGLKLYRLTPVVEDRAS